MCFPTDREGNQTTFTYDAVGNLISRSDPEGRFTRYRYDAMDRRVGGGEARHKATVGQSGRLEGHLVCRRCSQSGVRSHNLCRFRMAESGSGSLSSSPKSPLAQND
jgi:YD repeat-containing protein